MKYTDLGHLCGDVSVSESWKPIKVNPFFQLSRAQTPLQDTCSQPQLLPKGNLVSIPLP